MDVDHLRPSWSEVDLSAIDHNVAQLRSIVGPDVKIYFCLKGDASSCGAERVSLRAQAAGVDGFAFGNVDSAISCRRAGASLPFLIYPGCLPKDAALLERFDLMPTVSTLDEVERWSAAGSKLKVFLKIDGGGFRAGALPHDAAEVASRIASDNWLDLAGVYGHPMSSYGNADPAYVARQIDAFLAALSNIEEAGISVPIRMVSSSATLLEYPSADLNAVDPGRLLMGMKFSAVEGRNRVWRPVLVGLKSRLVMKKPLSEIGEVPPAPFFERRPRMVIGLLPLGWSDGYPRRLPKGASAILRGRRVALLGPVHSELLRIDLTDVPDAEIGDEVTLLGVSGANAISVRDLAEQWEVDEIGVYASIGKTLPRRYLTQSNAAAD